MQIRRRNMGGVFVHQMLDIHFRITVGDRGRGFFQTDFLGNAARVIFIGKAARHTGEICIAQPMGAIGKGKFHRLGNQVITLAGGGFF